METARRLLGVEPGIDADALRSARNRAAMNAHPDHGGTEEALRLVLEAHQMLDAMLALDVDAEPLKSSPRLAITPSIAMNGGRTATRLPDGRRIVLSLPPGLRSGDRVSAGGELLKVDIAGRPELFVSGDDLCMTVRAAAPLLINGGRLKVRTPGGAFFVWVPRQVGTNRIVRVLGKGLPARGRHPQGALILKLVPEKSGKETSAKSKRRRFGLAGAQA